MRGQWRWLAVVLGIAVLVATPSVIERLPVAASDIGAAELLSRVQSSTATPYSGYAQAVGGVTLPVTDGLGGLPDLLGDTTTLRAWYRAPDNFRVDTVRLAGERGLYQSPSRMWRWDYEQNTAVATPVPEPSLRLPREADLLPPELGQRLLSEATTDEVTRLPTRRIAGRDAPGLRLVPAEPQSTITEVDVWADPDSGLPLQVDMLAGGAARPVVSTAFLDFSSEMPDADTVRFVPPPGTDVQQQDGLDIASFADGIDSPLLPSTLSELDLRDRDEPGSVGIYGRGVTELIAAPLPRRAARGLVDQLRDAPGAVVTGDSVALSIGPLNVLITEPAGDRRRYLLSGTVTAETLATAAQQLEGAAT
ncbi:LolA family protein [Rhodococcus sp. 05-2255-1e]|uniref:LolA family protein n=2 Tax=Nocardiaceae TaxID=85025 RepID=UPI00117B90EE|nr:transcriptional regulator [Rhodococcus sp. 05-2255-1e]